MMLRVARPYLFISLLASTLLTGCGLDKSADTVAAAQPEAIRGTVFGGAQAIVGATVTLYAPATNGYGNAPTVIVSTPSLAGGVFILPQPYTCPANSGDVYILATGGNSGANAANSSIALAALLGPCNKLSALTTVKINEATTVAAAFALAPFATVSATGTGIGTSSTNLTGLNNAYGPATNLVNTATGAANAATSINGLVLPTALVNTLANILGYCVNSNGSTCAALFTAATPPGGVKPIDTFQAALDIALNPANNITTLFPLSSSYAPFQPALASQPNDFALGIQYTGAPLGGCGFTSAVAIDPSGNAWVGCGASTVQGAITEISPAGAYLTGATGFSVPSTGCGTYAGASGIAIDGIGNAWVGGGSSNNVTEISPSGTASSTCYGLSNMYGPAGIAVTYNGQVLLAYTEAYTSPTTGQQVYGGNMVNRLNTDGSLDTSFQLIGSGPLDVVPANRTSGSSSPYAYVNLAGTSTSQCCTAAIEQFNVAGTSVLSHQINPPATLGYGLAVDAANDAWYVQGNQINMLTAAGAESDAIITPAFTPNSLLFDGSGRLLVTGAPAVSSQTGGQLAVYAANASLVETVTANNTLPVNAWAPTGMDIDASGNVWLTGTSKTTTAFVTELVGFAAPLTMPRSVAAANGKIATRP